MPTYSYRCPNCGHQFELFHSISDSSDKNCPECDTVADRLMGAGAGISFKSSSGGSKAYVPPPPPRGGFT